LKGSSIPVAATYQCASNMNKTNKFVDPMEALFTPPPHKTKMEACMAFFYDKDEGSCLGRTPKQWLRVFIFYCVFYAGLAAFWATCMWGLLQTIDEATPTYILDESIIGTSPGLASRPLSPEGRESVLVYKNNKWSSPTISGLPSLDAFFEEYEREVNNTKECSYYNKRQNESGVCVVDTTKWEDCNPEINVFNICMFFKINKVFEWMPEYYESVMSLPHEMPKDLKDLIDKTLSSDQRETAKKVWLSCEGRSEEDKRNLPQINYFPEQGFPGYYYPFRNQAGFKSPVVAVHFVNVTKNVVINLECRAWAPNIHQDRKEQLGVLNYKIKIE